LVIIKTVGKSIDILDCFSLENPELGVGEISELTGYTASSVSRILATLRAKGCVEKSPDTGRYQLGSKILGWSQIIYKQLEVKQVALEIMQELRDQCGEEVALYIMRGDDRYCIERVESKFGVAKTSATGVALPLHCGAAGKVLLAYLPKSTRDELLKKPLESYTPFTITDREALEKDIEDIKRDGCAYSLSEREIGAYSIVAPVFNAHGQVVASLAISGPQFRLSQEQKEVYLQLVKKAALKISHKMGYG